MRSEASAETMEASCVVGQHDCRDSMECLSSLSKPDVVIANLPHGLNFKTSYDTIDYARDMLSSLAQGCRSVFLFASSLYMFVSFVQSLTQ